jgi:hypothetical protein
MATEPVLKTFHAALERLANTDTEKVLRPGLGDASLAARFSPLLGQIKTLATFASKYAPGVHDEFVNQARGTFTQIAEQLEAQQQRAAPDYINQSDSFLTTVTNIFNDAQRWKPPFAVAALEERGFLSDESIRDENRRAIEKLREEAASELATLREESAKVLAEAKNLAEEIENRARRTAAKISVEAAQLQFTAAVTSLTDKVRSWAIGSILSVLVVVGIAVGFMNMTLPTTPGDWTVGLYHTFLRVLVLGAAASSSAFCLKMLRAHMHMAEKNRHRVRVANSIESFVNSAIEPQQRDLILTKLASEVIEFGDSGLIRGTEEHDSPVMTADLLGRILAALSPRK